MTQPGDMQAELARRDLLRIIADYFGQPDNLANAILAAGWQKVPAGSVVVPRNPSAAVLDAADAWAAIDGYRAIIDACERLRAVSDGGKNG
jgi:NAD/NADP transhydrogenase alpha subunit